ncbi:hypothetical protein ACP4OV_001739 [Aristida adscensionis]
MSSSASSSKAQVKEVAANLFSSHTTLGIVDDPPLKHDVRARQVYIWTSLGPNEPSRSRCQCAGLTYYYNTHHDIEEGSVQHMTVSGLGVIKGVGEYCVKSDVKRLEDISDLSDTRGIHSHFEV